MISEIEYWFDEPNRLDTINSIKELLNHIGLYAE
jgi:hypothetical protein